MTPPEFKFRLGRINPWENIFPKKKKKIRHVKYFIILAIQTFVKISVIGSQLIQILKKF